MGNLLELDDNGLKYYTQGFSRHERGLWTEEGQLNYPFSLSLLNPITGL